MNKNPWQKASQIRRQLARKIVFAESPCNSVLTLDEFEEARGLIKSFRAAAAGSY
jgi:hypothetical protein